MKKILYFTMAVAICFAAVVSCKVKKTEKMNFEKCWTSDYEEMVTNYPDTSFHFFYAQATLNKNINEVSTYADVEIVEMEVLFQSDSMCITKFTHKNDGTVTKEEFEGSWMECMDIKPANVGMSLENCIDLVGAMECIKPASNLVVMRCPLMPPFEVHPYYIFGDANGYLSINSVDTTIVNLEAVKDSLSVEVVSL